MVTSKTTTLLLALAAFAPSANAHTTFTTLFVNGVDQGDGTCVRMPLDPPTATFPVQDLASSDMICGRDGLAAVQFTCAVPAANADKNTGALLTFEFRETPDISQANRGIDSSHKGPCSVYMKQLPLASGSGAQMDRSPSDGWFKIFEEGYDASTGQWCTDKLSASNGLLTVSLPAGLPAGSAYLVRPEILALHRAQVGDPQFYVGCAQIYLEPPTEDTATASQSQNQRSLLAIPSEYKVSIPGYVKAGDPSVSFNIYEPVYPYPIPGPPVFTPDLSNTKKESAATVSSTDNLLAAGIELVPSTCLVKNANWCGVEVPSYSTEAGCWDASENCWQQEKACYDSAPPSGHANCAVWDQQKCTVIQAACAAGSFNGPPNQGQVLQGV
ncbi:endoglucanase b [Ophiostoma piceae UAMH 11346]|uniref:lytic cellulose monooxygenase (C4-dehydrogenating) n=1 Tax=Ophiostoma piceae (strain UAMH 11346) TaxID=1262450 RepID=S3CTG0_OPHP1|nr:endoglucanase b [Ophiostoma piceae UAMH 11346]